VAKERSFTKAAKRLNISRRSREGFITALRGALKD